MKLRVPARSARASQRCPDSETVLKLRCSSNLWRSTAGVAHKILRHMTRTRSRIAARRANRRIHVDLNRIWAEYATRMRLADDAPFAHFNASAEPDAETESERYLQPWLCIFEEGVGWAAAYYSRWHERAEVSRLGPQERLPFALLGAVVNYAAAVKRLARSGLDMPARAVLRVMIESSHLALVLLTRPHLRLAFASAVEAHEARNLWRSSLSTGKVSAMLDEIESEMSPARYSMSLAERPRETTAELSQFVHPTFMSGMLANYAGNPRDYSLQTARLNVLGRCSVESRRTLVKAIIALRYVMTLFYLRASCGVGQPATFSLNPSDGRDRRIDVGFSVFSEICNKWWGVDPEEPYDAQLGESSE